MTTAIALAQIGTEDLLIETGQPITKRIAWAMAIKSRSIDANILPVAVLKRELKRGMCHQLA